MRLASLAGLFAAAVLFATALPLTAADDASAAEGDPRPAGEPQAQPAAETETHWYAVFMGGGKIGHVRERRTVDDGRVTTETRTRMVIGRGAVQMPVEMHERAVETVAGAPISFVHTVNLSGIARQTRGQLRDGTLHVTTTAGGRTETKTLPWPDGALLAEGQRLATRARKLRKGQTFTLKAFDTDGLQVRRQRARVGKKEPVDLLGRVIELRRIDLNVAGGGGGLDAVVYVDDDGEELLMTSAVMGMTLRLVACSREVARSENQPVDFYDRLLVAAPVPLENVRRARAITYTLAPRKPGTKLDLPASDSQTVRPADDGAVMLTVRPAEPAQAATRPYTGDDEAARAALAPSSYVESEDERIVQLAREAVGDTHDAAAAAWKLEAFARRYIRKKTLEVGYASAAEVARSKAGDCSEHAVFLAALCRAAGIPARVANGLAYARQFGGREHVFVPHAWVQAHVGGRWIGLDAALGTHTAGHILLGTGDGDPDSFFAICKRLGTFKITDVRVER